MSSQAFSSQTFWLQIFDCRNINSLESCTANGTNWVLFELLNKSHQAHSSIQSLCLINALFFCPSEHSRQLTTFKTKIEYKQLKVELKINQSINTTFICQLQVKEKSYIFYKFSKYREIGQRQLPGGMHSITTYSSSFSIAKYKEPYICPSKNSIFICRVGNFRLQHF